MAYLMRRREFIAGRRGVAARAPAQQPVLPVVAFPPFSRSRTHRRRFCTYTSSTFMASTAPRRCSPSGRHLTRFIRTSARMRLQLKNFRSHDDARIPATITLHFVEREALLCRPDAIIHADLEYPGSSPSREPKRASRLTFSAQGRSCPAGPP